METRILITGFGGQGVLFAGKFLAYAGLRQDREVSWLPSYGPEMRGGTAYCAVVLSDQVIGSPIVSVPDVLICMNPPSLDKFENKLKPNGLLMVDSSLITRETVREDVRAVYIPATRMANDDSMGGVANLIIIGKMIREQNICPESMIPEILSKITPERKKNLFENSLKALKMGYDL